MQVNKDSQVCNYTCVYLYAHQFCCLETDIRQGPSRLIAVAKEKAQVCLYSHSFPPGATIRLASQCQLLSKDKYVIKSPWNFLKIPVIHSWIFSISSNEESLMFLTASRSYQGKKILPGSWFLNPGGLAPCYPSYGRIWVMNNQWQIPWESHRVSFRSVPQLSSPATAGPISTFQSQLCYQSANVIKTLSPTLHLSSITFQNQGWPA